MNTLSEIQNTQLHKGEAQEMFLMYVRTRQLYKKRLRRSGPDFVHVSQKDLEKIHFPYPVYDRKKEITSLIDAGRLEIKQTYINGRKTFLYRCLEAGPLDISLIEPPDEDNFTPLHLYMREILKGVSLADGSLSTEYFNTFLQYKDLLLNRFFTVDTFAGRVHTPVTNFHRTHRPNILLDGSTTTSFDVAQMQPQILGKILTMKVGPNEYSKALIEGNDIYNVITYKAGLNSRDEGKKRFFEMLFAPANDDLVKIFNGENWIKWINDFKKKDLPQNPHNKAKKYSNMAWALQTMEVKMMTKVWQALNNSGTRFLSVHDEIIVKEAQGPQAEGIFRGVLDNEFTSYKLNKK